MQKIDDNIYLGERVVLCGLISLMTGLAFFTVLFRLIFKIYFVGCEDLIKNMVLWCTFLGGAIGARSNRHLNINILQTYLKEGNIKTILEIILYFVVFIVSAFLALSGYKFVLSQFNFGEDLPSLGFIKLWIFQIVMPYTFIVISFRYFLKAMSRIKRLENN